jgi:uncharacterized small protein (DUF1192 family)
MPTLEVLSVQQLRDRRAKLLTESGLTEAELRARAEDYNLTAEQMGLLGEIDDVDYLLGAGS